MAVVHFVGETYYHFSYGQSVPGLMLDYIAVSLLLLGGVVGARRGWGGRLVRRVGSRVLSDLSGSVLWRMEQVWEGRQRS